MTGLDDLTVDDALSVILDRAVERGGTVSPALRSRVLGAIFLFPVALFDGSSARCARTRTILASTKRVSLAGRWGWQVQLHTAVTGTGRCAEGRVCGTREATHQAIANALAATDTGWMLLDVAAWAAIAAADERGPELYAQHALPLGVHP